MGKATQDLRKEHEAILYVLQILDKMLEPGNRDIETLLRYYGEVIYFLKIFADKCHHGKEENYLFKELVNKGIPNEGGPVGVMLQEHTQGREYIAQMAQSLDERNISDFGTAAVQYRDLLRGHIEKENNALFVMADQVIDEQSQNLMFELFEQYEEGVIGHGIHEELHAMIDTWAEAFKMNDNPVEKNEKREDKKMKKYLCIPCGYIYDPEVGDPDGGIAPGTAFEDIPDDWVCPICFVGKDEFEPVEE